MAALVGSDAAEELLDLSKFSESPWDTGGLTGAEKAERILRAAGDLRRAGWSQKEAAWFTIRAARGSIDELENDIAQAKASRAGRPRDANWPTEREARFLSAVNRLLRE